MSQNMTLNFYCKLQTYATIKSLLILWQRKCALRQPRSFTQNASKINKIRIVKFWL